MYFNINNVKLHKSVGNIGQLPNENLPEIVISGRSNVGKSSLINCLLNRKNLARTSASPGKTALINYYNLDDKIFLVDLPGYGFARVSKEKQEQWAALIDQYLHTGQNISLIIQLIDIRHKPAQNDRLMVDWIRSFGYPYLIVCTKADKISKKAREENVKLICRELLLDEKDRVIPFSVVDKTGREELLQEISSRTNQ